MTLEELRNAVEVVKAILTAVEQKLATLEEIEKAERPLQHDLRAGTSNPFAWS